MAKAVKQSRASVKPPDRLTTCSRSADTVTATAQVVAALHSELNSLVREWQSLEHELSLKAKKSGTGLSEACRSDLPEAKAMRVLDQRIGLLQRSFFRKVKDVRIRRATSVDGALAKVQLALLVQGPLDWCEHARELVEDGIAELRALTQAEG